MSLKTLDKIVFGFLLLYALASSISIAAANVGVGFALLFAIVRYIKQPVEIRLDKRLVQAIGLFWATVLISALFAYEHGIAFSKLWAYIYRTLPLFLAAGFINSRQKMLAVLATMALSIGAADLYGIWQGAHGNPRPGAFSHYMAFSGTLIQMIPVAAILAIADTRWGRSGRAGLGLIAALSVAALMFNATRGAWIAVLVVAGLFVLLNLRAHKKAAVALCVFTVICAGAAYHVPSLHSRAVTVADISAGGANTERLLLWQNAWRMFLDHPLVGVGPGNFKDIHLGRYITAESKEKLGHAHNNFLHILAENGIIGFAGFIVMFFCILVALGRRGFGRNQPLAQAVFFAAVALLVQGFTEFNYGDSAVIRMFWFLLGLAMADRAERTENGAPPDSA